MPRPKNKAELITAASENFKKLQKMISEMTEKELNTPFNFSADEKKKEAHWKRDRNLRDVLIHLTEWHKLMIECLENNKDGGNVPFLPEEYNWKTYGNMNVMFWERNQKTSLEAAKKNLEESHEKIMNLIGDFSDEQLFDKGIYKWTGTSNLGSYFISVTSSHYDWAMKKLKAHKKMIL